MKNTKLVSFRVDIFVPQDESENEVRDTLNSAIAGPPYNWGEYAPREAVLLSVVPGVEG